MEAITLFDLPPPQPPDPTWIRMLADGYHPATGLRLRLDVTCDDCDHLRRSQSPRCGVHKFYGGVADETRLSWPGCRAFKHPQLRGATHEVTLLNRYPRRIVDVKTNYL